MSNLNIDNFILLISTTDKLNEKSFLEDLFKCKNQLLEINESSDHLNSYPFKLDNKYYDANIEFVVLNELQEELKPSLVDQVEVLGILFDVEQENYLNKIEEVYSKFTDSLQEKILICKSTNPEVNNEKILNWCCKNNFELVDLGETKEDSDDEEKDEVITEKFGFNRFVEILDTHSWSNIKFKDEQNNLSNENCSDLRSEIKQDNLVDNSFKKLTLNENGQNEEDLDEKKLTFEELFSQIGEFKEKADQLTGDDKYNYAKKVAMAFLNSLDDGDDDE